MTTHACRNPLLLVCGLLTSLVTGMATGDDTVLTRFVVPGLEQDMKTLDELHRLHQPHAFANCTLWDAWLPHATLWTGTEPRARYRQSLLDRRIDDSGYVSVQQHRGMAHSEGWPFPAWQQSTGSGWHFSMQHEDWAIQNFRTKPLTNLEGWEIDGAESLGIDPVRGLMLRATADIVRITTPAFRCGTIVAPFVRLEWAARGLSPKCEPNISWLLDGESDWRADRSVAFPAVSESDGMRFANVPLYPQANYAGLVTRYRVTLNHAMGSEIDLKSILTAIDTRHPITGTLFVQGCTEYFVWTKDVEFVQRNIERMRRAMRFTLNEFQVRPHAHVVVSWVGHDGRSGLAFDSEGKKVLRPGLGVGNNYWDLLPFGGHDALATIYLHDGLRRLADLERAIVAHPDWRIPEARPDESPDELTRLADAIKVDFQETFWNSDRGRFVGWIDLTGEPHDYGFTFVNLEAIHYGLANAEQSRAILDWLDGKRDVDGDTSRGADIYHWRCAPRATTRRNTRTYAWVWSGPESIPWGNQVQDGGAVLGFSYFDLMARLKTNGPDDAWRRLSEILAWFREVRDEGGYRAYYAKPGRGTLQGGGPPGGLGMDHEFLESVLVPQVMLYGFLGFQPTAEGFEVHPRLPKDWASLTVREVHIHDRVVDITANARGEVTITRNLSWKK